LTANILVLLLDFFSFRKYPLNRNEPVAVLAPLSVSARFAERILISIFCIANLKRLKGVSIDPTAPFNWVAVIGAKNYKRQRRKRQSVTAPNEKSRKR